MIIIIFQIVNYNYYDKVARPQKKKETAAPPEMMHEFGQSV